MSAYTPQTMQAFRAVLSTGRTLKVTAPSIQRAYQRVEKWIPAGQPGATIRSIKHL